jgi:3-isopropylmalate/(R)-2-methylmalate dehydratase small subunit
MAAPMTEAKPTKVPAFTIHTGIAAPLDRINVDTDAIVPKQFLRKIERTGFGKHLFHDWRFTDPEGTKENPEFVLNHSRYRNATVLLARDNFGCGSSREHAPWALFDYGFRAIIAPSFADIFANNCVKNGILTVVLKSEEVDELFRDVIDTLEAEVTVNLKDQMVIGPTGKMYTFFINTFAKECLLNGLDSIGWTEQFQSKIENYENKAKEKRPWLFKVE